MAGKKTFEERLAQIAIERSVPLPFEAPSAAVAVEHETPPRAKNRIGVKIVLVTGLLLALGAGAMALFKGKSAVTPLGGDSMNIAGLFDFKSEPDELSLEEIPAWAFLPAAPEGWIALTPDDAGGDVQEAIDTVALRYPGGEEALRAHPAFQSIGQYLDIGGASASLVSHKTPLTQGEVLYVHPSDGAFVAALEFRHEDRVLGFADTPGGWQDTLVRLAEDDVTTGAKIHRVDFQDYPAVNIAAPIDLGADRSTQLRLSLALNHRTILKVNGTAQPSDVVKVTEAVDPVALKLRVASLTGATPVLKTNGLSDGGILARLFNAPANL